MTTHATGRFDTRDWEETTVSEIDGEGKLTHVSSTDTFHGDIEGEAKTEYVMVYRADGSGSFLGLEHMIGRIAGRSGSCVFEIHGTFETNMVKGSWVVVPGSATGDLSGLRGEGTGAWDGKTMRYTLDYDFD